MRSPRGVYEKGSVLFETAVVAVVLLALAGGALTYASVLDEHAMMLGAVRAAARVVARCPDTNADELANAAHQVLRDNIERAGFNPDHYELQVDSFDLEHPLQGTAVTAVQLSVQRKSADENGNKIKSKFEFLPFFSAVNRATSWVKLESNELLPAFHYTF